MSNHFDYLLSEADTAPSVTADRLMLMAKTASQRYLHEGVEMNETIHKLAEDNSLNSHQVERVCEMANISTHQSLWPQAEEKEKIAFPLASSKAIVIRLGGGGSGPSPSPACPPPASMESDYMAPPDAPAPGPSLAQLFGADPASSHRGMHDDGPSKKVIILIQKKAAQKRDIENDLMVNTMKWESEKKAAYRAIKQEVLQGTKLSDIQDAAHAVGLGKVASELLPEFKEQLVAETHGTLRLALEKVAIAPAPEEYISNNLGNINVVNGAHPIVVSLDTLHKRDDQIKQLFTGLTRVNDELKVYGQKIREMQ